MCAISGTCSGTAQTLARPLAQPHGSFSVHMNYTKRCMQSSTTMDCMHANRTLNDGMHDLSRARASGSSGLGSVSSEQIDSSTWTGHQKLLSKVSPQQFLQSRGGVTVRRQPSTYVLRQRGFFCRTQRCMFRAGHLRHRQRRAPLLLQDIQADAAVAVDVGMVYLSRKVDLQGGAKVQLVEAPLADQTQIAAALIGCALSPWAA